MKAHQLGLVRWKSTMSTRTKSGSETSPLDRVAADISFVRCMVALLRCCFNGLFLVGALYIFLGGTGGGEKMKLTRDTKS